jgi:type II secretory pathway pseudopilin PulG
MTQTMGFRTTVRSESGFAIIEAVVSAAVLAIIAMAVLAGIDAASNSTGRERARAVAASLAEQDQERLRSFTVNQLSGLDVTRDVVVDGVTYKVQSQAKWITDDTGGTPACGNSSKNNEYLHITSTVTSSFVGVRVPAVEIDSLAAPSAEYSSTHGILGVKVVNRNAIGVQGIRVSVASTDPAFAPPSQDTDANGCAIFRQVPVATYTITLDQGGYVGTELAQLTKVSQKATPGNVTFKTIEYDVATTARVTVKTTPPGTSTTQQASKATKISLSNAKVTGLVKSYTNAAPASPLNITPLYPFKSTSYGFFTGSCAYQSPDKYTTSYFGTNPGSLLMDPTLPQPQNVTVLQPPFNLQITKNAANSTSFTTANLLVYAKLKKSAATDTCSEPQVQMTFKAWPGTGTWGTAPAVGGNWVVQNDAAGFDPGMPYGDYAICLRDTAPSPDQYQTFDYVNRVPGGNPTTVANSGSWSTTSCIG